ncbi:MAG: hypothetical protein LBB55_02440 [Zoogloeaceae bacterium]|jgi:SH3-like domain-containing protein|nr:hypothetical protein [Zoogloeaceae bacterium]
MRSARPFLLLFLALVSLAPACLFAQTAGSKPADPSPVAIPAGYYSVAAPVAILYDSPSAWGKKLYLVKEGTPLEVVQPIMGWAKVRDAEGLPEGLVWIENDKLSPRRTVIVIADLADVRQSASDTAPIAFQAEKWLILDLLSNSPPGWAKVRHPDGSGGFVRLGQVWGL